MLLASALTDVTDMLFSIISLVIAALCNPMRVMRHVWPYIVVLVAFAVFVLWNGGVVLGKKQTHGRIVTH